MVEIGAHHGGFLELRGTLFDMEHERRAWTELVRHIQGCNGGSVSVLSDPAHGRRLLFLSFSSHPTIHPTATNNPRCLPLERPTSSAIDQRTTFVISSNQFRLENAIGPLAVRTIANAFGMVCKHPVINNNGVMNCASAQLP
jgi:hypothetical protein